MRFDLFSSAPPETVMIEGNEYQINSDFRVGVSAEGIFQSDQIDEIKVCLLLRLYYPVIPSNVQLAVERLLWFYRGGEEERKEEKKQRYQRRTSNDPAYSFSQDAPYIFAAFKEQYGIDLTETSMHWWKFLSLFESLNEETKMSKIMYYRKASTSGMSKERRAFINDMKKAYKLDASGKNLTLMQRNQRWKDYVRMRHAQR